jgi:putative membrane protein
LRALAHNVGVEPFDEARDATRRTRLANERTYLAWWRSGLTALAVSFGVGRIVPAIGDEPAARWPFELVGIGFAVLGVAFIVYGQVRQRSVELALREDRWAPLDGRVALGFTVAGVVLGIATMILMLVD